ncbi:MAG: hypothetical protein GXO31_00140 [Epsilonproteobacteria bacterium]|nr:hypothetical protein [Campylobacterota bacterium]
MSDSAASQTQSSKLSQAVDRLLESYLEMKKRVETLEKEMEEKDKRIKELEDRLLEVEIWEEDIVSKIQDALNNNGL